MSDLLKIETPAGDLRKVLSLLSRIRLHRSKIPVLGCALVEAKDNAVTLTVTDLGAWLTLSLPARVHAPGRALLPFNLARMLVANHAAGTPITIEQAAGGTELTVSDPDGRTTLITPPVSDFPEDNLSTRPVIGTLTLADEAAFRDRLKRALRVVSTEETRYYLNGVCLDVAEGADKVKLVSTDGHRLIAIDAGAEWSPAAQGEMDPPDQLCILPRMIVPALTAMPFAGPILLREGENFEVPLVGGRIITSTIDGKFPDWRRVVPKFGERQPDMISFDRAELLSAMRRIPWGHRSTRIDIAVGKGKAVLSYNSRHDLSGFRVLSVESSTKTPEWFHAFDRQYLTEACLACRGDLLTIECTAGEEGGPVRIVSDSGVDFVLMPMRGERDEAVALLRSLTAEQPRAAA
ncbi:hypothetical protein H2509_20680 [Stappia sp. F7233]|uniref:Beta sliding clamp n=2 Tax=Stappia albiluteola TaxID=2758565 RepID=A0A839AKL5_9HYPH|nr:DNA polymerase III subunit beta [Stappia albiluteola]MBA5779554.1 hypothetical protein [Stappia albiluteola]